MSSPTLLLTRPEEENQETAILLEAKGFKVLHCPLMQVKPLSMPPPVHAFHDLQAILMTSRQGIRLLPEKHLFLSKPVYVVGTRTAEVAKAYGFQHIEDARGTSHDLIHLVQRKCLPEKGRLLYVSGQEIRTDIPKVLTQAGFHVDHWVVYKMDPILSLPNAIQQAFKNHQIQGVLFLSFQTASFFYQLIMQASLGKNLKMVYLFCLSKAVAQPLQFQDALPKIAPKPTLASLMEIIDDTF